MNRALAAVFLVGALLWGPGVSAQPRVLAKWLATPARNELPGSFGFATLGVTLEAHWDASDLAATPVATWTDNIASIATTATTTARPAWSATGFQGSNGITRAGVTCDGVANALVNTSFAALPVGSTEGEIWLLVNQQDTTATATVLVRYGGATAGTARGIQRATDGGMIATDGVGANGSKVDPTSVLFRDAAAAGGIFTNATFVAHLAGVAGDPRINSTNPMVTGNTRLRICANNTTSAANFAKATISDIVFTSVMTTAQRAQLEGLLSWRGGVAARLPFHHAYRFRQP